MIRETTADIIRRRRGMKPMDEVNDGLQQPEAQTVAIDVPPEHRANELAMQPGVEQVADPADVEKAAAMLGEQEAGQERPGSVPAQAAQAVMGAAPVDMRDEEEMWAARDADRQARNAGRIESAAKHFVSGVTQTPLAATNPLPPSQVPQAQHAARSRAERAAEILRQKRQAAQDQRQGVMDAADLDLMASTAERNRRPPEPRGGVDYTKTKEDELALRREALAETIRANKAKEDAAAKKANRPARAPKPLEDIPPGFEVAEGSHPGPETRKKFTGLVMASEKMKGLTNQMRAALKGTTGLSRTLDPQTVTALKQLGTMIRIEGKTVAELGALSGPDMGLMDAIAADPTSIKANLTVDLPRMLDQLDAWGANSVDGATKGTGIVRSKGAATTAPETKTVGGKTYRKVPGGWDEVK